MSLTFACGCQRHPVRLFAPSSCSGTGCRRHLSGPFLPTRYATQPGSAGRAPCARRLCQRPGRPSHSRFATPSLPASHGPLRRPLPGKPRTSRKGTRCITRLRQHPRIATATRPSRHARTQQMNWLRQKELNSLSANARFRSTDCFQTRGSLALASRPRRVWNNPSR
jgi:hypothetical protein